MLTSQPIAFSSRPTVSAPAAQRLQTPAFAGHRRREGYSLDQGIGLAIASLLTFASGLLGWAAAGQTNGMSALNATYCQGPSALGSNERVATGKIDNPFISGKEYCDKIADEATDNDNLLTGSLAAAALSGLGAASIIGTQRTRRYLNDRDDRRASEAEQREADEAQAKAETKSESTEAVPDSEA